MASVSSVQQFLHTISTTNYSYHVTSFISVIATMSQDQEGSNNLVKAHFSWSFIL